MIIPEPYKSSPLPLHVNAVSWVEGLALEEELELGLREASHQSSEASRHAPERTRNHQTFSFQAKIPKNN